MTQATMEQELTRAQLAGLAAELRHECARVERTLSPDESSDELNDLLRALQRIDDDAYGVCFACGRPIPLGRLQVMPATQSCIGCAR